MQRVLTIFPHDVRKHKLTMVVAIGIQVLLLELLIC